MTAIISECGRYRYRLERDISDTGPVFAYFGVNPSTADADLDDATVRKWKGFTRRNGGRKFIVGNAFAYRSTDVKSLRNVADPFGPLHLQHISAIIVDADVLVPCWGDSSKVPEYLRPGFKQLLWLLRLSKKPIKTFGMTLGGDPKHPLMLGYDTPLIDFNF